MKKNIIIFLFAIVAVALLVVYFIYRGNTTDNINTSVNSPAANVAPTVDLGQQEETYRREVSEIVKPFFLKQDWNNISGQLSKLRVPKTYLDFHLELVVSFNDIESGRTEGDQSKIEVGLEKLGKLREQYPWLGSE